MKSYQLIYLVPSSLGEEKLRDFSEKINSLLQSEEGVLEGTGNFIRKNLGYPIKVKEEGKSKKISEVYSGSLDFQLLPEKLANFETKLKAESKILRYLILNKPKFSKPKRTSPPRKERIEIPAKIISKIPKKAAEKKVELKEIEKKLEEILGQ